MTEVTEHTPVEKLTVNAEKNLKIKTSENKRVVKQEIVKKEEKTPVKNKIEEETQLEVVTDKKPNDIEQTKNIEKSV